MQIPKALTPTAVLFSSVTLLLGGAGGWLFDQWRMPLAWLVGAMVVTTAAALMGAPLQGSQRLRNIMIPILGVMLGSAFTPVALAGVGSWIPSLSALIAFIVIVVVCVGLYFHHVVGFGPVTSYFSATPGGLTTMVLIGADMGGDERNISLVHSIRILLTVLVIPFWFRLFEGYQPGGIAALGSVSKLAPVDAVVLIVCAVAGTPLARWLKVPSPFLLGPMIASAVAHLAGVTAAKPPVEIVNLAQLVIGTSIGARFVGISVVRVFHVIAAGALSTLFMLALAAAFAITLEAVTGLPFHALWLSFAPGGVAEMTLISLAMNIDPAMVSTHHLLRVVFMVFSAPLVFALLQKWFAISEQGVPPTA